MITELFDLKDRNNTEQVFLTSFSFLNHSLPLFALQPDSEVAQAGQNLETFFLTKLQEIFPDRTFVGTSQDRIDSSHIQLLSRKRKENDRKKKRYVFSGKKYYL